MLPRVSLDNCREGVNSCSKWARLRVCCHFGLFLVDSSQWQSSGLGREKVAQWNRQGRLRTLTV